MATKIIHAQSGHTLFVKPITADELPMNIITNEHAQGFDKFYIVRNWDETGAIFMYLCKGLKNAKNQICVFYRGGGFWSSYGLTIEDAINGAQKDGWMYA